MNGAKFYQVKVEKLKRSQSFLTIFATCLGSKSSLRLETLLEEHFKSDTSESVIPMEGEMCVAWVGPDRYERCRLIQKTSNKATVLFVDCGDIGEIPCNLVSSSS